MSIKKLFVCGDSFCVKDPEFGKNWVDFIEQQRPNLSITNLSIVGASNYLVYLQVKHAIKEGCDYIIYNATSSIRHEFSTGVCSKSERDQYTRYDNIVSLAKNKPMISASWVNPSVFWNFNQQDLSIVNNYAKHLLDMPNLVEKNYIYILHTLNLLEKSNIKWAWSRGGFEHKNFSSQLENNWDFYQYIDHETTFNLWDEYVPNTHRPYFHVTNEEASKRICNDYIKMLNL